MTKHRIIVNNNITTLHINFYANKNDNNVVEQYQ